MGVPPGRRIGILGGTFDPPHLGHLSVANSVGVAMSLDAVALMVAGDPWQKSDVGELTSAVDRLAMVEATVADVHNGSFGVKPEPAKRVWIEVSDLEVRRGGRTYTVDTLEHLRGEAPERELVLILGADAAARLHTWHRFRELPGLCEIAVVDRPGSAHRAGSADLTELVHTVVRAPLVEVSSSDLRHRVARGLPLDGLVSPGAISVITQRGLYAVGDDGD